MDVPLKCGIINKINNNDPNEKINQLSYNGYEKKQLLSKITETWDKKNYETSYCLLSEIHVSGFIKDYFDTLIEYFIKKLILKNSYYIYFFNMNLKQYESLKKYYPNNQHKYLLINSSEVRNLLAEFNNFAITFEKEELKINIDKKTCLSEEYISKKRTTIENLNITDGKNNLLTKNLIIGISEIFNIMNDNYNQKIYLDQIIYWLLWLLNAENKDKKNYTETFIDLVFSNKKKYNDFTYIIWNKLFKIIKMSNINNNCKKIIKSLYDIYYYNYSKNKRKFRIYLIGYAIYFFKTNKKIILRKNIDTLYLFSELKINNFYASIIPENLIEKNRIEYINIFNNYIDTAFKRKEKDNKIKNYKIAKINNKMEYLNILLYKNDEDDKILENMKEHMNNDTNKLPKKKINENENEKNLENNLKDDNIKNYFN